MIRSFSDRVLQAAGNDSKTPGVESFGAVASDVELAVLAATNTANEALLDIEQGLADSNDIHEDFAYFEQAAENFEAALEEINKAGIGHGSKPALTAEGFGFIKATLGTNYKVAVVGAESDMGGMGPLEATSHLKLGVESMLSDAGKTIRTTLYKFLDWIMVQVGKLVGGAEAYKRRATSIKAKADKFDGNLSKDKIKAKISILGKGEGAKMVDVPKLSADLTELSKLVHTEIPKVEQAADEIVDLLEKALDKPATDFSGNAVALDDAASKQGPINTFITANGSTDILGNCTLAVAAGTATSGVKSKLSASSATVSLKKPTKAPEAKDTDPMSIAQITGVCDTVVDICDLIIASRKKMVDVKDFKKKFEKIADTVSDRAKDDDYKKEAGNITPLANISAGFGKIATGKFHQPLVSVLMRAMNESLSYANASIKKAK